MADSEKINAPLVPTAYELKAQVVQLPKVAQLGVMSIRGVMASIIIFALLGRLPLDFAPVAVALSVWAVIVLNWASGMVLRTLQHTSEFSLNMRQKYILVKRGDPDAPSRVWKIPWTNLRRINLPRDAGNDDWLVFHFYDRQPVRIAWHQVADEIGGLTFVNAVHNWAPHVVLWGTVPGVETVRHSPGYTDLWLHELESPRGTERGTFLNEGLLLDNGRYRIRSLLGQGGQGATYTALDLSESQAPKDVVLKEYIIPAYRGEVLKRVSEEKLQRAADLLKHLNHPRIVKLLGNFFENGRGYLVLEYVEGKTLKELVALEGRQPESFVVDVGNQVCDILDYLHGLTPPVVHRDLTPDNLMVTDAGIKVIDFDVAQELVAARTTTVCGKHRYMPPEQFRGMPEPASDIYALGCTMYFLLTGQDPEPMTVARAQALSPSVSDQMESTLALATQLDSSKRIDSAQELRRKLAEAELAHGHK